tara:strand:+ start:147 stop:488 length:342 start_codon:yes stop_codon:yes gene_type:complete
MKNYKKIATEVGKLVTEKNKAYGDSFGNGHKILKVLYPQGVKPDQFIDMLATIRVIDKLFRLANEKDAFDESPWRDIIGYALLGAANDEEILTEDDCDPDGGYDIKGKAETND